MYCTQRTVLQSSLYCDQKNIHRSILSSRTNKYQRESFISIHPVGVHILFSVPWYGPSPSRRPTHNNAIQDKGDLPVPLNCLC
jgi:hypothetical protein